jgi:hypothetical protein
LESSEEKEAFNRLIYEFTESVGPNIQFVINLEEEQADDIKTALEYCIGRDKINNDLANDLIELLDHPGMVPYSAGILVVSLCAVDDYMNHLKEEGEQDELFSFRDLFSYLCANAEELVRTLH